MKSKIIAIYAEKTMIKKYIKKIRSRSFYRKDRGAAHLMFMKLLQQYTIRI